MKPFLNRRAASGQRRSTSAVLAAITPCTTPWRMPSSGRSCRWRTKWRHCSACRCESGLALRPLAERGVVALGSRGAGADWCHSVARYAPRRGRELGPRRLMASRSQTPKRRVGKSAREQTGLWRGTRLCPMSTWRCRQAVRHGAREHV